MNRSSLFITLLVFTATANSQTIEEQIRAVKTSTAALIVSSHPRLWLKGEWEWNKDNYGSFAWRIVHGPALQPTDPQNDQEKYEFSYCTSLHHGGAYSADEMYGHRGWSDYGRRILEPIIAGKAVLHQATWNFPTDLPGSSSPDDYSPDHTADEYFIDAREKLLNLVGSVTSMENSCYLVMYGAAAYDWLVHETLQNRVPVLSDKNKIDLQQGLLKHANYLKNKTMGEEHFFASDEIHNYMYVMVGLALYEPSRVVDPSYSVVNAQAKIFLDDFDKYWIGKILPALNEQGGDGGWHGGMSRTSVTYIIGGAPEHHSNNVPVIIAPLLFAHYTATLAPIENSVFSTGVLKYMIEFQNHMIRPSGEQYFTIGGETDHWDRAPWIFPRRRFSTETEQQKLGELGAWVGAVKRPYFHIGHAGSWDTIDQLLFEDKWANPRPPEQIGFAKTRHFKKLGWVFMRSGFTEANDLAALFICQRYHWSHLDLYAQNSFTLERNGMLIEGFDNTIKIDNQGQRLISQEDFPTLALGVQAYSPGSTFDVGSGVVKFESNDKYDYIMGEATNAYDKNKLEKFTRQLVYWKPDKFVIFDHVITKTAETKKSWVIDPGANPQSYGSGLAQIDNGAGELWIKRLLPLQATETMNAERFEVIANQPAKEHFFLHVMQTAESGQTPEAPSVKIDEARLLTNGNWIGVRLGADSVQFNVNGGVRMTHDASPEGKSDPEALMPVDFNLKQNSPNPFYANLPTDINYDLYVDAHVELTIFTITGQHVATLIKGRQKAGPQHAAWNGRNAGGRNASAGLYIYRLETDRYYQFKKMLFLK